MADTIAIAYEDLFEFLEDYRANLSQLQYTVQTEGPATVGDYYDLQIHVPVLDEPVVVRGRVMAPMGANLAGLQLESNAGEFAKLQGFYALIGRLVEQMLTSGRFLVAGQLAPGAAMPTMPSSPGMPPMPSSPGMPAAPSSPGMPAVPSSASIPAVASLGAAARKGKVNVAELTELFMGLYGERATGVLEVTHEGVTRRAFFKGGGIVAWRAEPLQEEECLGVLLARAGRINEDQLKQSLQMMNDTGNKQGECLIEMGVLTFPQVIMSLMTQVEIVTRNVFSSEGGAWSFHPQQALQEAFVAPPIKLPGFLFGFFKKHFAQVPVEQLEQRADPLLDRYVKVKDWNWDDFRLKKQERDFIDILSKKSYRYREIQSVSNVGRGMTINMLNALQELGAFQFEDTEDSLQVQARLRKELETKLLHMRNQNPFEMLELHWTSRTPQVEEAYQRMQQEYANYGRGADLPADVEEMRQEILGNIESSYASLHKQQVRQETRKKHYEPQQHEFSADLLARQADMLTVRNAWKQVVENLERACELQPGNGKYRAMLKAAKQQKRVDVDLG